MLEACHDRLQRMLDLLRRLRDHVDSHGSDAQAQQAARDVVRYFEQAAPQHHRDEELHVFPPLLQLGDARQRAAVQQLRDEHAAMESQWDSCRAVLQQVAGGALSAFSADEHAMLERFAALYAAHVAVEERLVYPAAQAGMDGAALAAMGAEMKARRGG